RRAEAFAAKHGIPRVVEDYAALVADPGLDAVYVPLPNGLHGRWTRAALQAGKHVLCEKPFTANAEEAAQVKAVAEQHPDLVVMEAFHYRYHPLFARVLQLLHEGAIGDIRHIDARLCFPLPVRHDIRWQLGLAGGSLMDAGCYTVHMLRHLAGAEPEVTTARARLRSPEVDRFMQADYRFSAGITGRTTCSMLSAQLIRAGFTVTGTEGQIKAFNPMAPQMMHRLTVSGRGGRSTEHVTRRPTYEFQLQAFADAVLRAVPPITGLDDALANMTVIDAVYRAAGLERREPTAVG
ncbi:MAG TPA: Gfo/Idh/MocA family oxidoreductase, partial [Acidimicrobiales bacterium]|nr:Gfo/Idh/MocA family oxidoreductase [Acidimicrobiales bacterium]